MRTGLELHMKPVLRDRAASRSDPDFSGELNMDLGVEKRKAIMCKLSAQANSRSLASAELLPPSRCRPGLQFFYLALVGIEPLQVD